MIFGATDSESVAQLLEDRRNQKRKGNAADLQMSITLFESTDH